MVTLDDARRVIAAAEKKAVEIGQPMNIAVADAGGNLVAHVRMDGAWLGSIDISIKKAFTSRAFDIATKDLAKHCQSGGQFFGVRVAWLRFSSRKSSSGPQKAWPRAQSSRLPSRSWHSAG